MGTIKGRSGIDLAEAEDIKKRWQEYTEELYKKDLQNPLDCKEIQPVHPKGDQSWVFIGRTNVEAETLILWPPDAES